MSRVDYEWRRGGINEVPRECVKCIDQCSNPTSAMIDSGQQPHYGISSKKIILQKQTQDQNSATQQHTVLSKRNGAKFSEESSVMADWLYMGWAFCQAELRREFQTGGAFFARAPYTTLGNPQFPHETPQYTKWRTTMPASHLLTPVFIAGIPTQTPPNHARLPLMLAHAIFGRGRTARNGNDLIMRRCGGRADGRVQKERRWE